MLIYRSLNAKLILPVMITAAVPTVPEVGTQEDKDIENEDRIDDIDYEADVAGRVSSFVKNKPTTRQYKAISAVHNENVHW